MLALIQYYWLVSKAGSPEWLWFDLIWPTFNSHCHALL